MLSRGEPVNVVTTDKTWLDIIYPWDILSLNATILDNIQGRQNGTIEPGVTLRGAVSVGENSVIRANSYVVGPVIIGKGCEIGPNACIFPATSIGNNVTVSPFTEVRNTVIGDDVFIGSGCFIEDSVLDSGCVIGPHFTAISAEAEIKIDQEHLTAKVGAMLGQGCHVGGGVTAQPGTIMGNFTQVKSLKLVEGRIPDRSLII
jgi:NDP-sugar pyrophosphorylase family protein